MNFFQLLSTHGSVSRKAIGLVKMYVAVINSFAALGDSSRHRSSATKVDRTPSVPLAMIIAIFTNVRGGA